MYRNTFGHLVHSSGLNDPRQCYPTGHLDQYHTEAVYDCPNLKCADYVRLGLYQDTGIPPSWHVPTTTPTERE